MAFSKPALDLWEKFKSSAFVKEVGLGPAVTAISCIVMFPTIGHLVWNFEEPYTLEPPAPKERASLGVAPNRANTITGEQWINGKAALDRATLVDPYTPPVPDNPHLSANKLWLLHGKYYDFTDFIHRHPGGPEWLKTTRGSDITEAFESHHINYAKAQALLAKYYVADAHNYVPRYTFDWYTRVRERVFKKLGSNTGATMKGKVIYGLYVLAWFYSFTKLCKHASYSHALFAGLLLGGPIWGVGHNFFHQRDQVWRFAFDLSAASSHEWRITHAMSHHPYPNSLLDFEVSGPERFGVAWLSSSSVPWWLRRMSSAMLHQTFFFLFEPFQTLIRTAQILSFQATARPENFIVYLEFFFLYYFNNFNLKRAFFLWLLMHGTGSWWLGVHSTALHHHPDTWHDGDITKYNDWGLQIVKATKDYWTWLPLWASAWGGFINVHVSHHLFPTIDHSRLHEIAQILDEELENHGERVDSSRGWFKLYAGMLARLRHNGRFQFKPNS